MVGKLLGRVDKHRWERLAAVGACARCTMERYTPGREQTNGMTGIGG